MTIIVTGAAGFIGFHAAERLLARGETVIGLDNVNAYYDPRLKRDRLAELHRRHNSFRFVEVDFADARALTEALAAEEFESAVHLGAQAGVRYSVEKSHAYVHSNFRGPPKILGGAPPP